MTQYCLYHFPIKKIKNPTPTNSTTTPVPKEQMQVPSILEGTLAQEGEPLDIITSQGLEESTVNDVAGGALSQDDVLVPETHSQKTKSSSQTKPQNLAMICGLWMKIMNL